MTDSKTDQERDAILGRMLNTPPDPRKPKPPAKKAKSKKKPAK